jgi:D-alanyl-D-alanine carboxypeptidase
MNFKTLSTIFLILFLTSFQSLREHAAVLTVIPAESEISVTPEELPEPAETNSISEIDEDYSVEVFGKTYEVPDFWRPRKIDPKLEASLDDMKLLPQYLTYKKYNIHVTIETYDALLKMAEAAKKDSVKLIVNSGFRSMCYQKKILERRLNDGYTFKRAMRGLAPPGYSEHMLGTAVDFVPVRRSFEKTDSYKWLQKNAARFGFKQSYSWENTQNWLYEPWHWKYCAPEENTR